jgi:hypothetical protein
MPRTEPYSKLLGGGAWLGFLGTSVFSVSAAFRAESPPFNVEGTVHFEWHTKDGVKTYPDVRFTVTVDGCRWLIHEEAEDKSEYDYNEAFHDGNCVFYVHSIKTAVEAHASKPGALQASNIANSVVMRGNFFRNEFAHSITPIWLAYTSGCYWRSLTNNQADAVATFTSKGPRRPYQGPEPFWNYTPSRQELVVGGWMDGISLPNSVMYLGSGPTRFTNSSYVVQRTTNFNGIVLPSDATLTTYWDPDQLPPGVIPQVLTVYRITLRAVGPASALAAEPPRLPGLSTIEDLRFAKEAAGIPFQSSEWLSEKAVKNSAEYAEAVKSVASLASFQGSPSRVPARHLPLVRLLVVFVVLLVPAFWALSAYKRKKGSNQITMREI